jgi:hypothetical protein
MTDYNTMSADDCALAVLATSIAAVTLLATSQR